jgi:hypothetical protein
MLIVVLAYPGFATGVSAAAVVAPSQARKCLQWQYHSGSRVETAFHADRRVRAGQVVSPAPPSAVSRKRAVQTVVPIGVPIMHENCRSIVSGNRSQNQRTSVAYLSSNLRSDVPAETQYHPRRIWYQPRKAELVSNDNPRRAVTIEAAATKSTQAAPRARHDNPENLRDTRLMMWIGLLLALGYLLFLTVWFWATRFRPRPARAGRGIDTGRRME